VNAEGLFSFQQAPQKSTFLSGNARDGLTEAPAAGIMKAYILLPDIMLF